MAIAPQRAGIGIRRHFTTEGVHPYDEVRWERRDARITNFRDGTVAFEQLGVEVPEGWSLNATNILAQKYFRGTLGTPEREWSLKQVADRVVDTITAWGMKDGYFVDEAEAEIFRDELKHLIIHQKAAFNSPVWFNIGVKGVPQQGSACQPYHALVSTPDGMVPIGRLVEDDAVGTKVLDAHGVTKILAVKHNGRKEVLRIHTKAGHQLDVTADHLVWRASDDRHGRFVPAGDLSVGDTLTWHRTESFGSGELATREMAEAALAGWLQSDGFVGQDEVTDFSLAMEATAATEAERAWVMKAIDAVFPDVRRHERNVVTQDEELDGRRISLSGTPLEQFVEKWGLRARAVDMVVPDRLMTAPQPVVAAYLRSMFQAAGYVSLHENGALIGLDMESEGLVRGIQALLTRFGIFSGIRSEADRREDPHGCWSLTIRSLGDRATFAAEIGFIDPEKAAELEASLDLAGRRSQGLERLEVERIDRLGELDVYDIQTESGEYLSANLRVHNCFILSVEDSMDSILNWYVEEGVIFKGGSGAGVNLSRIRSSHELLKGGGTASGPVSFMRGADASAGTIKSGGKTRRAAKMVILDVDHPDVEDFIWCKAIEERKARVLRDAGFDMDLDGADSHSTQYQNANNSVRVTDEFMQAVLDDADWALTARTDGSVIRTVKARDLFRQIAHAAWECADPGMQFDTTINKWHTAPNTGRINGSNPCSEYMHLDNSACNLASLNLLKFLNDDGSFDVDGFKASVAVLFTGQEIIVGNADYPTEKIAENSRKFRELGIGYANLGALLMANGLPYDSDGGRAWAGAITALMTGHAYATSARTAARMGPFAGFHENAEPMVDVLRMHQTEASKIDEELVPPELLSAAQRAWDEAVELAEEYGVRNSQASVLAPTGCLVGGTLVSTDRGLVRLRSLGDVDGDRWQGLGIMVGTDEGPRKATRFFVNGLEPVVTVETARGHQIRGTATHRVKVVDPETGEWTWRRLADLRGGDRIPLQLGSLLGEPHEVALPPLEDACSTGERHAHVPSSMTPELAELVGYFMGNGSLDSRGLRLWVTDQDLDVAERLSVLAKESFGVATETTMTRGYFELRIDSHRLARWWEACGFARRSPAEGHRGTGHEAYVPDAVLHANDAEVYSAFLRGLFEAGGDTPSGHPTLQSTSVAMVRDVQTMLLTLGLPTTLSVNGPPASGGEQVPLATLRLLDLSFNERWLDHIDFIGLRKSAAARVAASTIARSARKDDIPGEAALGNRPGYFFDTVRSAQLTGEELTYDLSVPENVTYVANGFISHNTIGLLMDCDTTGVEPDLGLVKTKKLVGGGNMSIVNQTVPRALRQLGYADDQIDQIVAYIDEHKTIVGAPSLSADDLAVFACSMGDNTIHYSGHVRMMGAVQPFISGAISKCVTGDTVVPTEDGLVRIGSFYEGETPDTFRQERVLVASLSGLQKTDAFYFGGERAVRKVSLRSGHHVTGTPNHRLLVAGEGEPRWKRLDEIEEGDEVAVRYGANLWGSVPPRIVLPVAEGYGNQQAVRVPAELTEDLAFLLGAYVSEGCVIRSVWSVRITNAVDEVLEEIVRAVDRAFQGSVRARIRRPSDRCPFVEINSKTVVQLLEVLGCGSRASNKRIPDPVLRAPRGHVLRFLQGLALDAYTTASPQAKWAICVDSPSLLDDLQAILTNLGIVHSRITKWNKDIGKSYDEVYASGPHAQEMVRLVPFIEPDKARSAERVLGLTFARSIADVIPGLTARMLHRLIPENRRKRFRFLLDERTQRVSRRTLERVAAIEGVELPSWLQTILRDGIHFSPVVEVGDAGRRVVYDLSVPTTHAFVGNGIVNHNTVNMPEDVTVEDVEQLHIDAWRLGIKAVAIYRDNCKVAQPLSTTKKEAAVVEGGDAAPPGSEAEAKDRQVAARIAELEAALASERQRQAEPVVVGAIRERLPRRRRSNTFAFRVADCEGYVTVGEYEDGRPGEVFVKVSKQGSTLAGIMDAFSISISLGLQHGVPLATYVRKYSNMKFEPAGITDDAELRIATSLVDYIFRRLALDYLSYEERLDLGVLSTSERIQPTLPGVEESATPSVGVVDEGPREGLVAPTVASPSEAAATLARAEQRDAPFCYSCGNVMQRAGSCYVCTSCGSTSGCS